MEKEYVLEECAACRGNGVVVQLQPYHLTYGDQHIRGGCCCGNAIYK